jgi:hypothetical protein
MSYLQLLGYRNFKTESEIKNIVLSHIKNKGHESIFTATKCIKGDSFDKEPLYSLTNSITLADIHPLNIFSTAKQQTWLVSVHNDLYCLLDDIELDSYGKDLISWKIPAIDVLLNLKTRDSRSIKHSLIDFDSNHRHWFYSISFFRNPDAVEFAVRELLLSSILNAYDFYMKFKDEDIVIEFKNGSLSHAEYGKYISGTLVFQNAESFYADIKINTFKTYNHKLVKLGFKLNEETKALFKFDDDKAKKLEETDGFFCCDIENTIYTVKKSS